MLRSTQSQEGAPLARCSKAHNDKRRGLSKMLESTQRQASKADKVKRGAVSKMLESTKSRRGAVSKMLESIQSQEPQGHERGRPNG